MPDGCYVRLAKEILRGVRNALSENEVDDLIAEHLDLFFLDFQHPCPIFLPANHNVRLRLALLVFQRTVEENKTWPLSSPSHLSVGDDLVGHDTVGKSRLFNFASENLLDTHIPPDAHRRKASIALHYSTHSLRSEPAHKFGPSHDELGTDGRLDERMGTGMASASFIALKRK